MELRSVWHSLPEVECAGMCADAQNCRPGLVLVSSVVPVMARTVTALPASPDTRAGQGMLLGDRRCHPLRAASDVLRPSGKGK